MDELSGKVAVVTGGASGIGLAMARAFAAEGMKLVLADIEAEPLEAAVGSFGPEVDVIGVRADVADFAQVEALRDRAVTEFGTVHVVCNNAGVSTAGFAWDQSLEDWEWLLGVNLWGVIHGIKAFTPLLIEQGEGHIVNTASMAGLSSPPFMAAYNVSKHSVVALSETLFLDLGLAGAEGVGVTVLCPGWTQTRIHEASRNRPVGAETGDAASEGAAAGDVPSMVADLIASGLDPADVAAMVIEAVKARTFYVLTHPQWDPMVARRHDEILRRQDPTFPAFS